MQLLVVDCSSSLLWVPCPLCLSSLSILPCWGGGGCVRMPPSEQSGRMQRLHRGTAASSGECCGCHVDAVWPVIACRWLLWCRCRVRAEQTSSLPFTRLGHLRHGSSSLQQRTARTCTDGPSTPGIETQNTGHSGHSGCKDGCESKLLSPVLLVSCCL